MLDYELKTGFWESFILNMDEPVYLIWVISVSVVFWGLFLFVKFHNPDARRVVSLIAMFIFFFLIFGVSLIGGGIYSDHSKDNAISHNRALLEKSILSKYDLDAIEAKYFRIYGQDDISVMMGVLDSQSGIAKGFNGEGKDDWVSSEELVHVTIDRSTSEAFIIPWDGVDKNFVDSLVREDWKK